MVCQIAYHWASTPTTTRACAPKTEPRRAPAATPATTRRCCSPIRHYDYGLQRLLSLKAPGQPAEFYLFDALTSPVTLLRKDGIITARYAYDAWGQKRHESGDSANPFGFTGHE